MIMSIYNQKEPVSGIYKIDFPNGKSYIGQSNDIIRRIREHNCSNNNYPISRAIKKYGKIVTFDLLEQIQPDQKDLMNEREKFYIEYYHTTIKEKGYNISLGGGGYKKEIPDKIIELQKDIINSSYTFKELSEKYEIDITTISKINNGKIYFNNTLTYPLRSEKKYHSQVLNENEINKIRFELKNNYKKSMSEISEEYHTNISIIQRINKGISPYKNSDYVYPIRGKNKNFCKFTLTEVLEIISLLKNTNLTQIEIAKKFNCNRKIIGQINSGQKYYIEEVKYPIRK